jgi:phage-related protein
MGPLLDALGRLGAAFVAHVLPAAQAVTRVFVANVLPLLMRLGQFVIGTIVPAIVRFAGIIADKMSPILAALGDFIRTRVAPAFALIVNKIQAAFVAAQPFIAVVLRIIGVILKVVGSILGFLIPILLKLIGPIFSLVFRIIGTAIGWFGKLLGAIGKIVGAFINAGASVGRFAVAVGQHVLTAIRWVAGLPGRILDALRGLGTLLFGIGKDLIQGFINGIQNIGHKVADAARAIVDKLPAVIKRALGIASPSKVMAALGEQAGAGFVGGLLGTVDAAGAAAGRLAAVTSGLGFPGAAVGAATAAGTGGGPVGVRVFIGDRELTDIVRVETDGALTGAARLIRAGAA